MAPRSPEPDQHDFPSIPARDFQARFDEETGKGRGPVTISATGSGDDATKGLDIAVGHSVMTAGQPIVPLDYGTTHLFPHYGLK